MRPKHAPGPSFVRNRPRWETNVTTSKFVLAFALALAAPLAARADTPGNPAAVTDDHGMWRDKDGDPTYKVSADGTVDWYTYSGFRRYHSECHVCHGPDGEGSSYAPALANSLKTISYAEFFGIVTGGKQDLGAGQEKVMPAFAENKNVMCYLNDIYVYLRARSQDAIPRGRPAKHADKPPEFEEAETKCMGGVTMASVTRSVARRDSRADRRRASRRRGRSGCWTRKTRSSSSIRTSFARVRIRAISPSPTRRARASRTRSPSFLRTSSASRSPTRSIPARPASSATR